MRNLNCIIALVTLFWFIPEMTTAQVITDSTNIKVAIQEMQKENYSKALKLFEKEAYRYKSVELLHNAGICYENTHDENYCDYFKQSIEKGFPMSKEEIFFYSCDPHTYIKLPIALKED